MAGTTRNRGQAKPGADQEQAFVPAHSLRHASAALRLGNATMAYAAVRGYLGLFAAVLRTFRGSSIDAERSDSTNSSMLRSFTSLVGSSVGRNA